MSYLRTAELARAVGVHPNTVRRYVQRGILPPVERSPSGYRRFTRRHLDCLRLAHEVYRLPYADMSIYLSGVRVVRTNTSGDPRGALELAHRHLALVRSERAQADLAADQLERWASGGIAESDDSTPALRIGQVARELGTSIDVARSWDRNGLLDVPRDSANGYRRYGEREISRMRVIRLLSRAGYSTSAILRMLLHLDAGEARDLRHALDTPRPDEDVYRAADRWISALTDHERRAKMMVALLEEFLEKQTTPDR